MNKERLTLLIALSITIAIIIIVLTGGMTKVESVEINPTTTTTTIITTTTTTMTTTTTTKPAAAASVAEQLWCAMKAKGWTDDECAGIMGNIMAECGGSTLNIQPYAHGDGKTSYGICQWHNERKSNMLNFNNKNYNTTTNLPTLEHQVDFLEYELNLYNINILNTNKNYEEVA